ncbi:MAG TPA: hypothetical protein VGG10_15030 [Rhizomicrobium sp.]|jgi:hypothetical protein
MNAAGQRVLYEAGLVIPNWRSTTYRMAAAREAQALAIGELIENGEETGRILTVIRETIIAMASPNAAGPEHLAAALQPLTVALKAQIAQRASRARRAPSEPRRYWLEG